MHPFISWFLWIYFVYWVSACSLVLFSTLFSLDWGVQAHYIEILKLLFNWAVRFSRVLEEEEVDDVPETDEKNGNTTQTQQELAPPSPAKSTSRPSLIHRDAVETLREKARNPPMDTGGSRGGEETLLQVIMGDLSDYVKAGFECIVEDEVTCSFSVEEIPCWNFLTRTRSSYIHVTWRLQLAWMLGFLVRYLLLVPVRLTMLIVGTSFMGLSTTLVAWLPPTWTIKQSLAEYVTLVSFRILSRSFSLLATFHDPENHPKGGGICVSNHTSPIDIVVLNTEKLYCLTGQKHAGMLGFMEASLAKVVPHLWFERADQKDRSRVVQKLKEHAQDTSKPPILLFPEGVCVNNTSVMQFRKGSFEASDTVYPVAMRYDARFGDAFWSQDLWLEHVLDLLSCWAIVCEVWFLPPMTRKEGEEASEFADRVKAAISLSAGLRYLAWDGFLKQYAVVKPKAVLKEQEKQRYSERLMIHHSRSQFNNTTTAAN